MANALRILGAALLIAVVYFADGMTIEIPDSGENFINLPHPAMLVITDTGSGTTVSPPVLFDTSVRSALRETGMEWRRFDDSFDVGGESFLDSAWKDAYRKALKDSNGTLPWILIGNGSRGDSKPLPVDAGSLVKLIKKYGGSQ